LVTEKEMEKVDQIIQQVTRDQSLEEGDVLLNSLHEVQNYFHNYIPVEAVERVADVLHIPVSKVYEVLRFYTMFSVKPRGKYVIRVCNSLPCHVTGGKEVIEALKSELGIEFYETTPDGLFTLEKTGCLGLCGVSPAIMINEDFFGNLDAQKIPELLEKFRNAGGEEE